VSTRPPGNEILLPEVTPQLVNPTREHYNSFMNERISLSPDVCNGKPVVRGTRITVQTVLEFLAAGDSIEDVLEEYPGLTRADVQGCLDYASRLMGNRFSVAPLA
jgi:uncharacterized protein (DUF433 family)